MEAAPDLPRDVLVIGLGSMGSAVATRLVDLGHRVRGYDVDSEARGRAADRGVLVVDDLAEAASTAEVVLSSLPDPAAARAVWLGSDGVLTAMRAGSFLLELSTIDPDTMVAIAREAPAGVRVVDSPVSGGPAEAESGTLSLIVGAAPEDLEHLRPLLAGLGRHIHHAGPVGAGKAVKIVNNIMSMTNILVAAEAFSIGTAYGVTPQTLFEILSVSGGTSGQFVKRFPRVLDGDFDPRFALRLATKDLGLGIGLAHAVGVDAPMTALAHARHVEAEAAGLGNLDHVAVLRLYAADRADELTPEVPGTSVPGVAHQLEADDAAHEAEQQQDLDQ